MSINVNKTECLVVTKLETVPSLTLSLKRNSIKQTEHFRYLGSLISSNGRCANETKRIALTKQAFIDLRYILRYKKISFRIGFCLLKCYVWSVFISGCESWAVTNETIKKVDTLKLWLLRRMQHISWIAHFTNESVSKQTCPVRQLLNTIQLQFFRHITRQENPEQISIIGRVDENQARGRQRCN